MKNISKESPTKILHLITGLNTGGAEMALYRLLRATDRQEFNSFVVCLIKPGQVGELIEGLGIPVISLRMPPGQASLGGFWQLLRILKNFGPDILQTWMYHADFLGLLAGKLSGVPAIAWNIRGSEMNFMNSQGISKIILRACAILSGIPQLVIVNSRAGQAAHLALGYKPRQWALIPNGIDTDEFFPDPEAGRKIRSELKVPEHVELIGMVARLDPQKGHDFFLEAAAEVVRQKPDTYFVCVGSGPQAYTEELQKKTNDLGLGSRLRWTGNRIDMPQVYNALDLYVSPSAYGEGFPNVIAEAMACGIPCLATMTGDSPYLILDTGILVPPRDSQALSQAIMGILNLSREDRAALSRKARERIATTFGLEKMVQAYSKVYRQIIEKPYNK